MADYLLDTNILRYWYDDSCVEHSAVVRRVHEACQPDPQTRYIPRLFVCVITVGEIEYGRRVNPTPDVVKQAAYNKFVQDQCPDVMEMTVHVAGQYGELKGWIFDHCGPKANRSKAKRAEELVYPSTGKLLGIDENDLWIAAAAKTYNLVLVSHDSRGNFGRLLRQFAPDLTVEDWAL